MPLNHNLVAFENKRDRRSISNAAACWTSGHACALAGADTVQTIFNCMSNGHPVDLLVQATVRMAFPLDGGKSTTIFHWLLAADDAGACQVCHLTEAFRRSAILAVAGSAHAV